MWYWQQCSSAEWRYAMLRRRCYTRTMFAMLLRCCCDALGASVKSVCVNSEAAEAPGFPVVLQICLSLTRNSRVTAMWSRLRQDKVKEP